MRTFAVAVAIAIPALAAAEPIPLTVGARVGGYGFRNPDHVDAAGNAAFDDCRMNGLGAFARHPIGPLFAEAGADLYFARPEDDMDRVSGALTAAGGADLFRTRWVSGHVQLGLGVEATRVEMTAADGHVVSGSRILPLGFVGIGAEVALGRTSLGGSVRTHVMGHFDHDHGMHTLDVSPEVAAQGQLYVAYRL